MSLRMPSDAARTCASLLSMAEAAVREGRVANAALLVRSYDGIASAYKELNRARGRDRSRYVREDIPGIGTSWWRYIDEKGTEDGFSLFTGLPRALFNDIVERARKMQPWRDVMASMIDEEEAGRRARRKRGRPPIFNTRDIIALTLRYLLSTSDVEGLIGTFHVLPDLIWKTLGSGLELYVAVLREHPDAEIAWPDFEKQKEYAAYIAMQGDKPMPPFIHESWRRYPFFWTDGVLYDASSSYDRSSQRGLYNGKVNAHVRGCHFAVAPDCLFIWANVNTPGTVSDLFSAGRLAAKVRDPSQTLPGFCGIADTAYKVLFDVFITPLSFGAEVHGLTTEALRQFMRAVYWVYKKRQAVEWVMNTLQDTFKRLRMPMPTSNTRSGLIYEAIARTHNLRVRHGARTQMSTVYYQPHQVDELNPMAYTLGPIKPSKRDRMAAAAAAGAGDGGDDEHDGAGDGGDDEHDARSVDDTDDDDDDVDDAGFSRARRSLARLQRGRGRARAARAPELGERDGASSSRAAAAPSHFPCTDCHKVYASSRSLARHSLQHFSPQSFSAQSVASAAALSSSAASASASSAFAAASASQFAVAAAAATSASASSAAALSTFRCSLCDATFSCEVDWLSHEVDGHPDLDAPYVPPSLVSGALSARLAAASAASDALAATAAPEARATSLLRALTAPLDGEAAAVVDGLFAQPADDLVIVKEVGEDICRAHFHTLKPDTWVSSFIVNFYGCRLVERSERRDAAGGARAQAPRVHVFSSNFYNKLTGERLDLYNYSNVERWMRQQRLGDFDILLIPINYYKDHWAGAAIWPKRKEVAYFDSLGRAHRTICSNLARWFVTRIECESSGVMPHDERINSLAADWKLVDGRVAYNVGQQVGGDDCGIHMLLAFNYIAQGLEGHLNFTHSDIANARRVIALDIAASTLSS